MARQVRIADAPEAGNYAGRAGTLNGWSSLSGAPDEARTKDGPLVGAPVGGADVVYRVWFKETDESAWFPPHLLDGETDETLNPDREQITGLIAEVARSEANTYDRASDVWSYSLGAIAEEWVYHPLWLLWGALTDWVEVKPEETEQAEVVMREAARQFLPIADDDDALRLYFDRWLYEEHGGLYARPAPRPKNPPFSRPNRSVQGS